MLTSLRKKILPIILLLASPLSIAAPYSSVVVFGDSLSDNGNLAASVPSYDFLNSKPYNHGFNNGLPAVEQLAKLLNLPLMPSRYFTVPGLGSNFAVAGARAAGSAAIDLNSQVAAFLAGKKNKAPSDALYVVFIGGNDIRDMRDQTNDKTANQLLEKLGSNVKANLVQLLNAGAKNVLVVNAPDIGKIPETSALASKKYGLAKRAYQKTVAFNNKLADVVMQVEKQSKTDIVLFDLQAFFNNIITDSKAYHFNDTTHACFSSVSFVFYPICNATKIDSFVFFDEIHPTQRVHERLGRAFFAAMPEN